MGRTEGPPLTFSQGKIAHILADLEQGHLERLEDLDVPPLPAVAAQVLQRAAAADADARGLAALVERDPGLAATVLRVVRSPLFAGTMPISTLQQAIARLGIRSLTEIVVAACLRPGPAVGPNRVAIADTWRHAVGTASFARRITVVRRRHVESAYLCGLLHTIGKLVLLRSPEVVDPALIVLHHAQVGVVAARRWQLPELVVNAILHHARWESATTHVEEAATTWLASRLATDPQDPAIDDDPVLDRLTLYPEDIVALRAQADAVRTDVAGLA